MGQEATFYLAEKGGQEQSDGLFRKRILYEGKFTHPHDPKQWMNILPEHISLAVKNFKEGVMDRVQMYFTHNEDPRNLAGKVVGLEEGVDPSDGKKSLYAVLKPEDPAAIALMKSDAVGVSAKLDHWYREHLGGRDLGMTVKHVALVGEGYIKNLGQYIPIPGAKEFASNIAALSEHTGAIIYLEENKEKVEKTEEEKKKEAEDQKKIDDAKKLEEDKKKESKVPATKEEVIKAAKDMNLAVLSEEDLKKLHSTAAFVTTLREHFKLSESDDVAKKIIDEINTKDTTIAKTLAEREVMKLIEGDGKDPKTRKLLPAQKEAFVGLYVSDRPAYDAVVKTLQPVGVKLGEDGKDDDIEHPEDKVKDQEKNTKDGLIAAHKAGIPLSDDDLVAIGIIPSSKNGK
jgi:hypothetical protein